MNAEVERTDYFEEITSYMYSVYDFVAGIPFNIVALYIIINKGLKNIEITNYYLMNLCICNMISIIVGMFHLVVLNNEHIQKLYFCFMNIFDYGHSLTLIILSVRWFIVVFRHFCVNRKKELFQTKLFITSVWLFSVFFAVLKFYITHSAIMWSSYVSSYVIEEGLHLILVAITFVLHVIIIIKLYANISTKHSTRNVVWKQLDWILMAMVVARLIYQSFHFITNLISFNHLWSKRSLMIVIRINVVLNPMLYISYTRRQRRKLTEYNEDYNNCLEENDSTRNLNSIKPEGT